MRTIFCAFATALVAALVTVPAGADIISGFTEEVSPEADGTATEPYIDIDHTDGTVWVA
jgi:hypothetical protein